MHNKLRRQIGAYLSAEISEGTAHELLSRAFVALGGPVDESKNPMKVSEAAVIERVVERIEDKGRRIPTCVDGSCSLPGQLAPLSSGVGVVGTFRRTDDGPTTV